MVSKELVTMIEMFAKDKELELEMSLSTKSEITNPRLSDQTAINLYSALTQSAKNGFFTFTKVPIFADFFYADGTIRNRCEMTHIKSDEKNNSTFEKSCAMEKSRVAKLLAVCKQRDFSFHFNLKREKPLPHFEASKYGQPEYIRLQKSYCFTYKDSFRYILKYVQEGGVSIHECLQKPHHYELEIELEHNDTYFQNKDAALIATSFVAKCLDLCGRKNEHGVEEVPLEMVFLNTGKKTTKQTKKRKLVEKKDSVQENDNKDDKQELDPN